MGTQQHNDAWQSLVTTALLGTGRGAAAMPAPGGKAGTLLERVPAESAEERLLAAAGILSLYGRGGWRPAPAAPQAPSSAPEDKIPACSRRAGSQLRRVLEIGLDDVLKDWCCAATRAGVRAPDEMLPALLNLISTRGHGEIVEDVTAALGTRGRWLASLNPKWPAAISPEGDWETAWQTGSAEERIAALRELRRRDPDRARELVKSTWTEEEAEARAAILQVLRSRVSPEDEELLETALADKRKPVRVAAADLLARLPGSKYCGRLGEETRRFVQFESKRGLLGRRKVTLTVSIPPEELKLAQEGIEAKASGDIGPRAMMLAQMIAATPLGTWAQMAESGPKEILAATRGSEWHNVLVLGWTQAAARQRDAAWAEVMLRYYLECTSEKDLAQLRAHACELMACLGPETREAAAEDALRRNAKTASFAPAWDILRGCEHVWSRAFSAALFDVLAARFDCAEGWYEPWMSRETAGWLAVHLDTSITDDAMKKWSKRIPDWQPARQRFADELLSLLQFRREYLKELSP